jgi:hypothetical protein
VAWFAGPDGGVVAVWEDDVGQPHGAQAAGGGCFDAVPPADGLGGSGGDSTGIGGAWRRWRWPPRRRPFEKKTWCRSLAVVGAASTTTLVVLAVLFRRCKVGRGAQERLVRG